MAQFLGATIINPPYIYVHSLLRGFSASILPLSLITPKKNLPTVPFKKSIFCAYRTYMDRPFPMTSDADFGHIDTDPERDPDLSSFLLSFPDMDPAVEL